jgi:protein-disulfide isomerase
MKTHVATALLAAAVAAGPAVTAKPAPTRDWSKSVAATPQGGFLMGNPEAKAKLVEYGSLSCSHCATFDQVSFPRLLPAVKAGTVAYEFRNYLLDPYDLAATLVARCGGSATFFPVLHQVMASQSAWKDRIQAAGETRLKPLEGKPSRMVMPVIAEIAGFKAMGAARGLSAAKMQQCLSNEAEMERLIAMTENAREKFGVSGTPTFFVNNKPVTTNSWDAIDSALKAALAR